MNIIHFGSLYCSHSIISPSQRKRDNFEAVYTHERGCVRARVCTYTKKLMFNYYTLVFKYYTLLFTYLMAPA